MIYKIKIEWYEDVISEMGRLCTILKYQDTYENALNYVLRESNEYTKKACIYKNDVELFILENKFDPNP